MCQFPIATSTLYIKQRSVIEMLSLEKCALFKTDTYKCLDDNLSIIPYVLEGTFPLVRLSISRLGDINFTV